MNNAQDSWDKYSKLVLLKLEENENAIKEQTKQYQKGYKELMSEISDLKEHRNDIFETKIWKDKVLEVWSTTQMQSAKDEIYIQKGKWIKLVGVIVATEVVLSGFAFLAATFLK